MCNLPSSHCVSPGFHVSVYIGLFIYPGHGTFIKSAVNVPLLVKRLFSICSP